MDLTIPKRTRPPKPRNDKEPDPVAGARWIPLTKGAFAIVDESDFDELSQYSWRLTHQGYASRDVGRSAVSMHRQIMRNEISDDKPEVDHINGSKLDNRRGNLRVATVQQNRQNRKKNSNNKSGYKGVVWHSGRWQAQIRADGRLVVIGRYDNILEAATAYQGFAIRVFGEFNRSLP